MNVSELKAIYDLGLEKPENQTQIDENLTRIKEFFQTKTITLYEVQFKLVVIKYVPSYIYGYMEMSVFPKTGKKDSNQTLITFMREDMIRKIQNILYHYFNFLPPKEYELRINLVLD